MSNLKEMSKRLSITHNWALGGLNFALSGLNWAQLGIMWD